MSINAIAEADVVRGGAATTITSVVTKVGLCFLEARLRVQAIFLLRLIAGAILARGGGEILPIGRLIGACVVWELTIASVYLLDGVMDVVEDRLNGSQRPIARGDLPRSFAATTTALMAAAALGGAVLLGPPYVLLVCCVLLLGYAYCVPPVRLKRWSGSAGATVTVAGLFTFVAGAAVYGQLRANLALCIFAIAMSLWMGLVGAVAKDFSDLEGDTAANCRTIAVTNYERAVRMVIVNPIAVASTLCATATAFAPVLLWPGIVMIIGAAGIAVATLRLTPGAGRSRRRLPYDLFMVTQYAVHGMVAVTALQLLR